MDDQQNRRLFIAFITFILGLFLGGGLVMFCSAKSSASVRPAEAAKEQTEIRWESTCQPRASGIC